MSATMTLSQMTISISELVDILLKVKGSTMVGFTSETVPRLLAGNPWVNLVKSSRVNANLCFDYEKAVNRQRIREGKVADFVVQPRKWGKHIGKSPVVEHKGKLYLNAKINSSTAVYIADGKIVTDAEVYAWMGEKHSGRQHVDKTVESRDFSMENIRELRMDGIEYIIN